MSYLITNQNNFPHIPYPCPSYPQATVKTSGCGPCAVLNCVENMTSLRFKMADWISYVMDNGARIDGGTSISRILTALKQDYGFEYTATNDEVKIKEHLAAGKMGVFHGGYGNVFSSAGHFLALAGMTAEGKIILIDSGWYQGKYSGSFRKQRVAESTEKGVIYSSWQYLEADKKYKQNQSPNYYLITAPGEKEEDDEVRYKTIKDVPEMYRQAVQRRINKGILKGDGQGNINVYESAAWQWTVDDRNRYETLEDVPEGEFREVIGELVTKGYIKGDGQGVLDLSEDTVRMFVINYRAGLYD